MKPLIDPQEIRKRIGAMGWAVSIDQKQGVWQARAKAVKGKGHKPITRVGTSPDWALWALYHHLVNRNMMRVHAAHEKFSAWNTPWHNMSEEIARAYAEAPVYDSKAEPHWQSLANESQKQADAIRNQVRVERTAEPDPYLNIRDMTNDVHKNQHLFVSTHHLDHPYWNKDQHLNFKIAHAILGNAHSGGDHTWLGRNLATAHHMPMITAPAREALFMDRIARPAYRHHYDGEAPHKITTLSHFLTPVAQDNGEHLYVPHGNMDVLHVSSLLEEFSLLDESGKVASTAFIPFDS